ncbi:hypothetical protein QBC33DRAFT_513459 [Phialemonium atrogriseum]|uniref:Amidoligase enzyme n=1 Tax=Phialemonium atrogriseum TaxID=1093897 RepID=A0AAJ0FQJ4_9PEZI|nr:uncharacterized protein QBC33DRAFT_513459 [Phialemonium atrogriseum]KAK1769230.1 hypothetical protein QBC33DRAFT_513459 [Phialemonium atrogriseum]
MEIELLVRPKSILMSLLTARGWSQEITFATNNKQRKQDNRDALRAAIAQALTTQGLRTGVRVEEYKNWTVTDEPSLDEVPGFWRIELVSRAMTTAENWQREVADIFEAMYKYCDITLTKGCSMHVHVSPSLVATNQTMYTMDDVRKVLKAVAYFDDPMTRMMPADRKANEWAKSNIHSDTTPSNVKQTYLKVRQNTWKPLFRIYDNIKNKHHLLLEFSKDKFLSWNFRHLVDECGTIEFRRPPGVRTAAAANHWVSFTLGFASEALRVDWRSVEDTTGYPSVENLATFVKSGIVRLEQTSRDAILDALLVEDISPSTVYSAAELEIIKRKKAEKAKAPSPFAEKANSRPNTPASRTSSPGAQSTSSRGKK